MAYLDEAVALRSSQSGSRPSDQVIERVSSEAGEKLMESVREATKSILDKQSERLRDTEQGSRELSSASYRAILLGNLIALAIISTTGAISYWDRRKRDESESTLAAKESELSAIFNSTSDAILTFDNQLHIRLMNPSACRLLGMISQRSSGILLSNVIEAPIPHGSIQSFVDSNLESCHYRGHAKHAHGEDFPLKVALQGRFRGKRYNILVFHDLTEKQRAESSRRELAAILDQVTDAIVVSNLQESWFPGTEVPKYCTASQPARQ